MNNPEGMNAEDFRDVKELAKALWELAWESPQAKVGENGLRAEIVFPAMLICMQSMLADMDYSMRQQYLLLAWARLKESLLM